MPLQANLVERPCASPETGGSSLFHWTQSLGNPPRRRPRYDLIVIGVLPGEGVGPAIIDCALNVLDHVASASGLTIHIQRGGLIGRDAERVSGGALSAEVIGFCESVFDQGGAIFNGPGGGRYVYDLRKRFDLFFKISPLRSATGLPAASPLRLAAVADIDILVVRENSGGVYQGDWSEHTTADGERVARQSFGYSATQVRRFLQATARLAAQRRGRMTVVWKEAGVPAISRLWHHGAEEAARAAGIRCSMVDVDLMAYRLIQDPGEFDVIATPNLFGDVLGDLGAVLIGSRGNSFSGNYSAAGDAVYQTNHGAAYDLAGQDRANPAGQIFSLAMMLRESFGLSREADAIEEAVRSVWREGWRTDDMAAPGTRVIGTRQISALIAEKAGQLVGGKCRPYGH